MNNLCHLISIASKTRTEPTYRMLTMMLRGFYNRIAVVCADDAMRERCRPDEPVDEFIAMMGKSWPRRPENGGRQKQGGTAKEEGCVGE